MFKNNANNGDIKIRETIDENLNNISNTSNLQGNLINKFIPLFN